MDCRPKARRVSFHLVVDKAGNTYEYLKCDIIENPSDDKNHCFIILDKSAINHSISLDEKNSRRALKEDTVDKSIQKSTVNCFECGKISNQRRLCGIQQHTQETASCQYCWQDISTLSSRKMSYQNHPWENSGVCICPECLKVSTSAGNMTKHYSQLTLEMLFLWRVWYLSEKI